jgi:hypothetical protein
MNSHDKEYLLEPMDLQLKSPLFNHYKRNMPVITHTTNSVYSIQYTQCTNIVASNSCANRAHPCNMGRRTGRVSNTSNLSTPSPAPILGEYIHQR